MLLSEGHVCMPVPRFYVDCVLLSMKGHQVLLSLLSWHLGQDEPVLVHRGAPS